MNKQMILKALSVATSGSSISSYLPAPLAAEVIGYIREINILRRLVRTFNQNARTWTKPKRAGGSSAYFIPDGTTATMSSWSSTSVQWVAKKLMSYVMIDEEAVEDSQPDVIDQILMDFADAMAEAEELAMAQGDTTHTATAPTPDSATTSNWYVRDPRLMFKGIFTAAADTSAGAATSVAAGNAVLGEDMVNEALYNLGKYGRNKARLAGMLPSVHAAQVRENDEFKDVSKTGLALASMITGLGSAGEGQGLVTAIYGIPFYEIPQGPAGTVAIINRNSPSLGDRRRIKLDNERVIESDQRKFVTSERISFNYDYPDALVAITGVKTTIR